MFLKKITLDMHAQGLSKSFETNRNEFYTCITENLRNAGSSFPSDKSVLAGRADQCLKGIQLLIGMVFVRQRRYVSSENDANILLGAVMHYSWESERDAVSEFAVRFRDDYNSPRLVASAAHEMTKHIFGREPDSQLSFVAMNVISRTLAPFPSATKFAIAKEFGDKQAMKELQAEFHLAAGGASGLF